MRDNSVRLKLAEGQFRLEVFRLGHAIRFHVDPSFLPKPLPPIYYPHSMSLFLERTANAMRKFMDYYRK